MQSNKRSEQSAASKGSTPADTDRAGSPDQSREAEADDTRSGRPMPEEDAGNRTEHHKSGYGGEGGEPRERSGNAETGSKPKK
ncbi:MAG TPA: hypothetical protein VFZ56_03355 [Gemmatimonadaceae bacterium]